MAVEWSGRGEDLWSDAGNAGQCDGTNGIGRHRFQAADYAVFGITLSIAVSIGVFVGCFRGKNNTASAFLVGNRSMHFFPVALSMVLGHSSSVVVLGNPVEMYNFGLHLYVLCLAFLVGGPLATALFLPVYENLAITSVNEYLKLRFHNVVRIVYSCAFVLQGLLNNGLSLYAPSLALAEVTNLNPYLIVGIVFGVCVFYASVGGIRAIIWSDSLMFFILLCTMVALTIRGTDVDGGMETVWNDSLQTGRLQLFGSSAYRRYTFSSVFFGGIIYWIGLTSANQASVQRLLTLPNNKAATKCIWLAAIGNVLIFTLLFYTGMLIYSNYKDCDPVSSKLVKRSDQLLPLYVMDVMYSYPGVPGLFVACIFSTSIGAAAAVLNGMAAVTLRDFVIGILHKDLTDVQAGTLSKIMSVGYGLASVAFLVIMSRTGGMLQTNLSMLGLVIGIALGEFFLGMFIPWANWKGAAGGILITLPFMLWLSWSTRMAVGDGRIVYHQMPISVNGCLCNATIDTPEMSGEEVSPLLLISTMWYAPIGLVLFLITAILISAITGFQDPRELDQALISPLAKWFFNKLPASTREFLKLPIYEPMGRERPNVTNDTVSKTAKIYDIRL